MTGWTLKFPAPPTMLAASVLASFLLAAQASLAAPVPISATGVTEDRLPQPEVRLGDVRVFTDVTYSRLPGYRPLRLDLYRVDGALSRPLVLFVHGGMWTSGHKRATAHFADFPGLLADLARLGFVVASIEYRLSGERPFPGAVEDVKAATDFLRSNAGRFGIDAGRVALWGGSAGAHLAAMAALTDAKVQAYVGWYGPFEIDALLQQSLAAMQSGAPMSALAKAETEGGLAFFGCTLAACPDGVVQAASPLSHVDPTDPPSLLVHGTADTLVPHAQSQMLAAAMRKAGVPVELVLIEGAGHGWKSPTAEATTAASRQAVAATFEWLQKQFLKQDAR